MRIWLGTAAVRRRAGEPQHRRRARLSRPVRRHVLALRGLSITSDQPLPAYEHNLLGGPSSLRGFDTGYKADDNLAASAELRIPLTSPLSIGRFGVKIFADYGAAYPHGKLADQTFDLGVGGGAYAPDAHQPGP